MLTATLIYKAIWWIIYLCIGAAIIALLAAIFRFKKKRKFISNVAKGLAANQGGFNSEVQS
jgi:hypothetical protein